MKKYLVFILQNKSVLLLISVYFTCLTMALLLGYYLTSAWIAITIIYMISYHIEERNNKAMREYCEDIARKLSRFTDISAGCQCPECRKQRGLI